MKKQIALFLLACSFFALGEDADKIDRIKWSDVKGTLHGTVQDKFAVSATSMDGGVRELQMITLPGTKERITVFVDKDEKTKKFKHTISIPKNFPYKTQIEPCSNSGGLVVTVTLAENSFWILWTHPDSDLIKINDFP